MRRKGMGEILFAIEEIPTFAKRIEFLQQNDSTYLRDILVYGMHPALIWDLPEGAPPYKKLDKYADSQGQLFQQIKKFYYFIKGVSNSNQLTREKMFIQMLESVDALDAELLILMKDKKMPKNVTPSLIHKAFPGLLPEKEKSKANG